MGQLAVPSYWISRTGHMCSLSFNIIVCFFFNCVHFGPFETIISPYSPDMYRFSVYYGLTGISIMRVVYHASDHNNIKMLWFLFLLSWAIHYL